MNRHEGMKVKTFKLYLKLAVRVLGGLAKLRNPGRRRQYILGVVDTRKCRGRIRYYQ